VVVSVTSLLAPDSPRLAGENDEHTRLLSESEAKLPPIIVSRGTMRVIDGAHRLRAALLRGQDEIEVCFFDGDEDDAFVLAVESNIRHGLPLSLADRTVAATRIIASHPHWSDRAIASAVGLAPKTVGAIRRRSTGDNPQLRTRVGRDGRFRPLDSSEGRRRAGDLLKANPTASLRQVAATAGISQGTARDVRNRLLRGESPVPQQRTKGQDQPDVSKQDNPAARDRCRDRASLLGNLKKDPSLRFNEAGRTLIRLLNFYAIGDEEQKRLFENIPPHCIETIAELAYECAQVWQEFAQKLMEHGRSKV
jgi:ParB-like chromosome segregation protein Spo0J